MTEEIKKRLQDEYDELDNELRVHLPKEIKRTREYGDLRENAEYHATLERQRMVQARMGQLRVRLREMAAIDLSKIPHDRAGYGSTLVLFDPQREEQITYKLVTPEESDPPAGLISTVSPIGQCLMGTEEGDEVTVRTPAGMRRFEVISLKTYHDSL